MALKSERLPDKGIVVRNDKKYNTSGMLERVAIFHSKGLTRNVSRSEAVRICIRNEYERIKNTKLRTA